ncbi:CD36 family protein (macronuclear) [Tetrahymena thermophila SB210]|uniref:CD36 family protein n=1 Tax=Tetrahymena thermophila (strain SB210) TaxID=312017 RepID=I7MHQ4_TETTS|nr:CD36 family protein [Tetrahymena thermophila SB210]EAR89297.2 CD36 family protein [Tetrahymena thermophila SB210]|eukprot:XP_001009542.2 CD36 family protein [Tetrahymena thermophila SB210]
MQNNTNQNVSQPNSQQQHPYNVEQTNQSNTRDNYHYEKGMRALRKYKKIAWFTGICGFLLLIVGIVMPIILINFIKDQAKQQVVMQQSNYDQWGQIPGDTGMVLERQFTFFNWTNAERFFIYGDKPTLNESQTVYYQEFQNFTNPQYNEDGSIVSYQFQEFFLPIKGSTGEELQTVVNLGPMGFWYQIKQASRVQVGSQAFYGLISGLVDQLLDTIDIGVMSQTQINTIDNWKKFLQVGDQQPLIQQIVNVQDFIFNDPNYGIHSNSYIWMVAFKEMISSQQNKPTCMFLVNYFKINYNNLSSFFTIKHDDFQNSINAGRQLLVKGQFECTQTDEQLIRACLAAGQWSATKLGMSIVEQNKTTTGFPEINFFQENYFKDYIDSSDVYQKIQFPQEWAEKVTYYIQNPVDNTDFTKNTNTLLNQGNLGVLYTNGELYDKTKEIIYLKTIADRFEINEQYFGQNYLDAAYLFWEYAKYIVDIFAESKNYKNGGSAVAGLTGAASQGLYTVFSETQDILAITLISPMIRIYFKLNNIADCQAFQNYVNTNLNSQYQLCIDASPFKQFGSDQMDSMKVLYECNMYGGFSEYCNSLNVLFGNKNFIQQLTSDALPLIQKAIQFADSQMQTAYNCQNEVQKKCSYYEIAVKQWYNMEIIRNIPPILIQAGFPNPGTDTLKQWAHELPHAYEWGYYVEHFKDTFTQPPPQLSYDQLVQLLGFDYLFSGTRQIQMFLIDTNFETTYFFQDPNQIRDYLRWITAFTAFGLTQTRKSNDLLSGYKDDFLYNIASMNPQAGGDPSTGYMLNFNDINMTETSQFQSQAMYTGKSNYDQVRQYQQVNGLEYISFLKPSFDGFQVHQDFVTPWAKNIPIVGTDAGSNQPDVGKHTNLPIFVTTVYTGGYVANTGKEQEFHGINTYKYEISGCIMRNASVCSQNADVYSYYYDYAINLTSILQAPVFNTKTHMYQMQPNMSERIVLYNKDGNLQYPNEWDDTQMYVEPYTGVSLGITLNLQGVLLFEPDLLFNKIKEPVMIPFFYVYRSGNFTQAKVDDIYGALKAGLLIQQLVLYIGCSLGAILLLAFAYSIFAIRKLKKSIKPSQLVEDIAKENEQRLLSSQTYL